ncbi:MAG: PAS domain S-box protein [Bdellovibrionales bacterium]|nr:PAS domain S-box protein [Bdellovibrionales bacterium]
MPNIRKKTKTVEELIKTKDQLASLKKTLSSIYMSCSEEHLPLLISKELPHLCQVDEIELSTRKPITKRTNHIYSHSFTYLNKNYFIHFYKAAGVTKKDKWLLKKVGQTLEATLIRIEEDKQLNIDKEQWELAFDTIAIPICLTDLKGNILRTNKTFREKTRMSKIELLQKNYFTVFFKRPNNINKLKFQQKNKRREKYIVNGQEKIVEISLQKVPQNTRNEIQLVILRDITEQIKMEHKIAQSAKAAELGIISSSIAHELNNPIAGIQTLLQTLHMENKNPHLTDDLKEMSLAIQRCHHIIHQLLNVHRSRFSR